uniref:SH2 domain-containing protein n=1 Tax=Elaeophora elaphi TaxID=1147741 RepID=A0A0R3RZS2_9BILA
MFIFLVLNFSAPFELKGVIVKLENHWFTISVILSAVELDSFEASSAIASVKLENNALSEVLKLGSWVLLRVSGKKIYQIVRECSEVLPTYVYKDRVLLKTNICFQEKEQEGYGCWVWSPELGRIAAVCHERYTPKQNYVALVSRKPAKYDLIIEYDWMLTKYIEEPSLNVQFDVIFQRHRVCRGRKDSVNLKELEVNCGDSEHNYSESIVDDEQLFFGNSEAGKRENSTSNNIYPIIMKVVSNPNVRLAMQKYRPKELLSMCEALSLKFSKLFIGNFV